MPVTTRSGQRLADLNGIYLHRRPGLLSGRVPRGGHLHPYVAHWNGAKWALVG
jgi:hypothetical protein